MNSNKSELVPFLTLRHGNNAGGCVGATAALAVRSAALIVTGCMDGRLLVWSSATGRELAAVAAHNNMILTLMEVRSVDDSSVRVFSHGRDGYIRLWTIRHTNLASVVIENSDFLLGALQCDDIGLCKACFSSYEKSCYRLSYVNEKRESITSIEILTANSGYSVVRQYELPFTELTDKETSRSTKVGMCMQISHLRIAAVNYWLTAHENGCLILWVISDESPATNTKATQRLQLVEPLHFLHVSDSPVMAFDYSEKLGFGLCGSADERLTVFELVDELEATKTNGQVTSQNRDAASRKTLTLRKNRDAELTISNAGVSHVKFNTHGRLAAVAGWDNRVRIVLLRRLQILAVIALHRAAIHAVFWSDCDDLLVASEDALVTVWTAYRNVDSSKKESNLSSLLK